MPPCMRSRGHAGAAAGEHLVRVSLVADVPHQAIVRRIEDMMQGDRQFDRTEVRRQVATGPGNRLHQEGAQLVGQLRQLSAVELAQLRRIADGVEKRITAHGFLVLQKRWCCDRKRRSELALSDEIGQFDQALAAFAETWRVGQCLLPEIGSQLARAFEPHQADVGRLFGGSILARRLAQRGGAGRAVEDVVDHLEQQAGTLGKAIQRIPFGGAQRRSRRGRRATPQHGSAHRS
jgi:hypothetical protein